MKTVCLLSDPRPHETEFQMLINSEAGTDQVAAAFAEVVPPEFIVGLSGPLGAGKTAFVRAFLRSLAPGLQVNSPSFVLEQLYSFTGVRISEVSHWDLYRLPAQHVPDELKEAMDEPQVVFIEWPERAEEVVKRLAIHVVLGFPENASPDPVESMATGRDKSRSGESRLEEARLVSWKCNSPELLGRLYEKFLILEAS